MRKPNKKTVRASIRGSVPDGKLKRAKLLLSNAKYGQTRISGFTEYADDRKTVAKLGTPMSDDAAGITIRGHETRHATKHTRSRKKPMTENEAQAGQIVDDVNVESIPLPHISGDALEQYRRAHLATAVKDLRDLLNDKSPDSWQKRNNRLLAGMRIKAMLRHYREGTTKPKTIKQAIKAHRKLAEVLGTETSRALTKIIQLAQGRYRARAISLLTLLMETADAENNENEDMPPQPDREGDLLLMPVTHGDAMDGHMEINDLRPKSAYTAKERTITRRYAPDGVHLNVARYVNAIVSGDSNGLFARRLRRKAGGTVVIDASGSMGATAENLTVLARLIPTATIAYYSGHANGHGTLAIYAHGGMRYSGQLPDETLMGGNAVDLPAVRWLMANAKPWTLVSDLEFTGGVYGSEIVAHALVERAQKRGELTVYGSLDAAYEAFGGKDMLADAMKLHSGGTR